MFCLFDQTLEFLGSGFWFCKVIYRIDFGTKLVTILNPKLMLFCEFPTCSIMGIYFRQTKARLDGPVTIYRESINIKDLLQSKYCIIPEK